MKGRLRIHIIQNRMTYAEADTLSWYLEEQENVTEVKVYERTADAVICYKGEREEILTVLKQFSYEKAEVPETVLSSSGRQLNEEYKERLITKTVLHYGSKLFLPMPVRAVITSVKSVNTSGKGFVVWHMAGWKFRYWMQQRSVYRCSEKILQPQVLLCSCWESVRSLKSGRIKSQ